MKRGFVLEGGAMRGLFTAGVLDELTKQNITPDGIAGVSAGAAFGCNVKSRQPGRVIRYNKRFANDSRYSGLLSFLKTGNIFNAEFAYHRVPEEFDLFDNETFLSNPMEFYAVCTDVRTGTPVYHLCEESGNEFYEWIRASASMPLVSKIVNINGQLLLDGGLSDSIPLEFMQNKGYKKNIVVLTRPEWYLKKPSSLGPIISTYYHKYPNLVNTALNRHVMYNKQLEYIRLSEQQGSCFVFRPPTPLPIGHLSHSPSEMQKVYDIGVATAKKLMPVLEQWWNL
ncbi:MAG: patatin family protein [Muribaculum sp.]|nr:patatin family protein [Muribaculaceae bacterium]MCM1081084.1 patatin family protein [Muribaculum sp.]